MHISAASLFLGSLLTLSGAVKGWWAETPDEVAQRSRSLLTDSSIFGVGVLSTIYSQDYAIKELRGFVASGTEYFAPCYANGDLLMLAMPVSQNWKNALTSPGKNASFTIMSNPDPSIPDPRHETSDGKWDPSRPYWRKVMYSKQRLNLFGHLETLKDLKNKNEIVQDCYFKYHPDATHFMPGSKDSPHLAIWTRFIVDRVYRVGGYGDESQIGWLDMEKWQKAGEKLSPPVVDAETTNTGRHDTEASPPSNNIHVLFGDNVQEEFNAGLTFQG